MIPISLKKQIQTNNLFHAYLVRIEKDQAEEFASDLIKILKIGIADWEKIYPKKGNISISQISSLRHFLSLKPLLSQKKIAFIFQAETLSLPAAHSLLKTLEEPPPSSIIFLFSSRPKELLPTILSRCQFLKTSQAFSHSARKLEKIPKREETENFLSFKRVKNLSIGEKFDLANKLSSSSFLSEIIDWWTEEERENWLKSKEGAENLKNLLTLQQILKTEVSIRLQLENLFLKLK